jgi:hypothetical protein
MKRRHFVSIALNKLGNSKHIVEMIPVSDYTQACWSKKGPKHTYAVAEKKYWARLVAVVMWVLVFH